MEMMTNGHNWLLTVNTDRSVGLASGFLKHLLCSVLIYTYYICISMGIEGFVPSNSICCGKQFRFKSIILFMMVICSVFS